ncbi:MAG: lipocalin family protein, partial [Acidobacteriota bacterium]
QGLLFASSDVTQGQGAFLLVSSGQDLQKDLRSDFEEFLTNAHTGLQVTNLAGIASKNIGEGYQALHTAMVTEDKNGQRIYRYYLAVQTDAHMELILYFSPVEEAFGRYIPVLQEFINNLSFLKANASSESNTNIATLPSKPSTNRPRSSSVPSCPAAGTQITGLYVRTESYQQFNMMTKFYDYIIRDIYYLFLANGGVYFGVPSGGTLDNFDFTYVPSENLSSCGCYKLLGDRLEITRIGNNESQKYLFKRDAAGNVQLGQNTYYRVKTADGIRLNGTYRARSFVNLSGGVGGAIGSVSGDTTITFNANGSFTSENFSGYSVATKNVGSAASTNTANYGSYRISSNTLELTYANGQQQRRTFFVYPDTEKQGRPQLIVIDGTKMTLR